VRKYLIIALVCLVFGGFLSWIGLGGMLGYSQFGELSPFLLNISALFGLSFLVGFLGLCAWGLWELGKWLAVMVSLVFGEPSD
jgi:hypothetical protein